MSTTASWTGAAFDLAALVDWPWDEGSHGLVHAAFLEQEHELGSVVHCHA
jgi:hypothetical protein